MIGGSHVSILKDIVYAGVYNRKSLSLPQFTIVNHYGRIGMQGEISGSEFFGHLTTIVQLQLHLIFLNIFKCHSEALCVQKKSAFLFLPGLPVLYILFVFIVPLLWMGMIVPQHTQYPSKTLSYASSETAPSCIFI